MAPVSWRSEAEAMSSASACHDTPMSTPPRTTVTVRPSARGDDGVVGARVGDSCRRRGEELQRDGVGVGSGTEVERRGVDREVVLVADGAFVEGGPISAGTRLLLHDDVDREQAVLQRRRGRRVAPGDPWPVGDGAGHVVGAGEQALERIEVLGRHGIVGEQALVSVADDPVRRHAELLGGEQRGHQCLGWAGRAHRRGRHTGGSGRGGHRRDGRRCQCRHRDRRGDARANRCGALDVPAVSDCDGIVHSFRQGAA